VDILAGNLVWIQGPYPAGKYTDIKIFNKVLRHFLEPGERVEADEGYRSHPDKIKCPGNDANPAENRAMQGDGGVFVVCIGRKDGDGSEGC
jgi:hypothetical protein